ncbi:hypothetical protein VTK26DRAFT_552 [Humicola hyalothermophila]
MEAAKNIRVPTAASPAGVVKKDDDRTISSPSKQKPIHYPFWFGGSASSMAACVTHPLDLVKVGNHGSHQSVSVNRLADVRPPE